MKLPNFKILIMAVSTGVVLLFLGTVALTYAQQEQRKQDAKLPKQAQQDKLTQQQARPARQEQQVESQREHWQQQQQGEQRAFWQEYRAHSWQSEHHNWQERGGYKGYRIPAENYRGYFGPDHAFRIYSYPVVAVGGYPRFLYGGFWFSAVDPWPEYWSDNWYENDDVYIDYSGDGYYLYNHRFPRDRIAITVYVE